MVFYERKMFSRLFTNWRGASGNRYVSGVSTLKSKFINGIRPYAKCKFKNFYLQFDWPNKSKWPEERTLTHQWRSHPLPLNLFSQICHCRIWVWIECKAFGDVAGHWHLSDVMFYFYNKVIKITICRSFSLGQQFGTNNNFSGVFCARPLSRS